MDQLMRFFLENPKPSNVKNESINDLALLHTPGVNGPIQRVLIKSLRIKNHHKRNPSFIRNIDPCHENILLFFFPETMSSPPRSLAAHAESMCKK